MEFLSYLKSLIRIKKVDMILMLIIFIVSEICFGGIFLLNPNKENIVKDLIFITIILIIFSIIVTILAIISRSINEDKILKTKNNFNTKNILTKEELSTVLKYLEWKEKYIIPQLTYEEKYQNTNEINYVKELMKGE